jgi:hypothetical protein
LIRKTFPVASKREAGKFPEQIHKQSPEKGKAKSNITILSNENPNEKKLNILLGLQQQDGVKSEEGQPDGETTPSNELKVDVTLRTQLGQAPMIMLLFAVDRPPSSDATADDLFLTKVSISFEVGLNGRVSMVEMTGLLDDEDNTANDANVNTQTADAPMQQLQSRLAQVLETSQDIGILVEWVLRWVRRRKSRG